MNIIPKPQLFFIELIKISKQFLVWNILFALKRWWIGKNNCSVAFFDFDEIDDDAMMQEVDEW